MLISCARVEALKVVEAQQGLRSHAYGIWKNTCMCVFGGREVRDYLIDAIKQGFLPYLTLLVWL